MNKINNKIKMLNFLPDKVINFISGCNHVCPYCESESITYREDKKPTYKCKNCKKEFNTPQFKIIYQSYEDWKDMYDFS